MSHIGPLVSDPGRTVHVAHLADGPKAFRSGVGLSLVWTRRCVFSLYRTLVCIFKHSEGQGGRGGSRQRLGGQFEFRVEQKKKKDILFQECCSAGKPDCFRILVSTPFPTLPVLQSFTVFPFIHPFSPLLLLCVARPVL